MTHLKELVSLLPAERLDCFGHTALDLQVEKLCEHITGTKNPTDEGAAGSLALLPGSARYRKVKNRLKYALINRVTALHPGEKDLGDRTSVFKHVWKLIAIGKSVRTTVGSEILIPYLERAFQLAEQYELVDAAFETATMLRRQFTNRRFNRKKYRLYKERARHYRDISRDYHDVTAALNEVIYLRNIRSSPEVVHQTALAYFEEYEHLISRHDVVMISYLVFFIRVNAYLVTQQHRQLILVASEAISYLDRHPQTAPQMYQVFEANLAIAYAQLNDYESGIAFARRILEKTTPRAHNYIKSYELILILNLRSGNFQGAYENFISIDRKALGKDLMPYYRETFDIIQAYLYLLIDMGQISPREGENRFTRFKINRFLNSFDHSATEKSHRNVHLLIIRLMDHLVNKRHSQSMDSIDAITKYSQRYLKGNHLKRCKNFMKALAQLSAQSFHAEAVKRHTSRYLQRLRLNPLSESKQPYEMELIPYEMLWEMVMGELGLKRIVNRRGDKKKEEED